MSKNTQFWLKVMGFGALGAFIAMAILNRISFTQRILGTVTHSGG